MSIGPRSMGSAVAVSSVVLFHLAVPGFSGGYVGVDVFFVISGYLITRLIVAEIQRTGEFSFANFYVRRARRLFPAFFVTLVLSFIAAYSLLAPQHLEEFGASLAAAILSASNFYFWSQTGYFDTAAQFKPLLHTWSLSVEEQFYLAWPALLFFAVRGRAKWIAPAIIVVVGVVSLAANLTFQGEQVTPFYLTPFRAFEFAIGAVLVFWQREPGPLAANAGFAGGIALIAASVAYYTAKTPFPSFYALVPCLGAGLVIFCGRCSLSRMTLQTTPAAFIGKISYSLYLVHWPLFIFYSYRQLAPLDPMEGTVLVVASVAISAAMYRYVEQPFRSARWRIAPARFGMACAALAALVIAPAASAWAHGGWLWRFPTSIAEQLSFKLDQFNGYVWVDQSKMDRDFAHDGKVKVLVAGDSQGGDLINALNAGGAAEKMDLSTVMHYGCPPATPADLDAYLRAVSDYTKLLHVSYDCKARLSDFRIKVLERKPDVVIISAFWFDDKPIPFLPETAAFLLNHGVKKVFVVGFKQQEIAGVKLLATHGLRGNAAAIKLPLPAKTAHINSSIGSVASNFTFIDPADLVCDDKGCSQFTDEGYIIFYDGVHLTPQGAKLFGRRFMNRWGQQILD